MKVNGSFQSINHSDKPEVKKKSTVKRFAKAAAVAGVAVGAAALYANRKTPVVQKFVNILNNDILAPLKEKDVPVKDKIANIGEKLRNTVNSFMSKRNSYDDIVIIEKPAGYKDIKTPLALPERTEGAYDTMQEYLNGLIYKNDGQAVLDIPVKSVDGYIPQSKQLALPAPKEILALPEKAGYNNVAQSAVSKIADAAFAGIGASVLLASVGGAAKGVIDVNETKEAKNAEAGAETAPVSFKGETSETPGITASESVEEKVSVKGPGIAEKAEKSEQKPVKSDKITGIKINGKEFEGMFDDGMAYDEEVEPLTGKLTVTFESGKAAVLQYEDGVLKKSVIFKNAADEAPEEIKTYKDGKIHQKLTDITFKDGAYNAKTTYTYRASDSMLQTKEVKTKKGGKYTKLFKNNLDEQGNIKGAPIPVLGTTVKNEGSIESRKFYTYDDGERIHVRTSIANPDGTKNIQLMGNDGKPAGMIMLDNDRKVRWYVVSDNPKDGYLNIEDGRVVSATTDPYFSGNLQDKTIMEYENFRLTRTEETPVRKPEEGEKESDVPSITTRYFESKDGATVVVTNHMSSNYVKKVEFYAREDAPVVEKFYDYGEQVTADYSMHKSSLSPDGKTSKLVLRQFDLVYNLPTLEKLDCSDEETDVYKKADGTVLEVEKDKKGYITSIANYADEETMYPEFITTFDHGTPVQDTFYNEDGKVIFNAKYSVKPVEKKPEAKEAPREIKKSDFPRDIQGYTSFNETYNVKTFHGNIWKGKYYESESVKEISRDENDVYRVALLNPYSNKGKIYEMLLDQEKKIQKLDILTSGSDSIELFMDEHGHIEKGDLEYANKTGELVHVAPFKKNLERYQTKDDAVIEFVKDDNGAVVSIAYYENDTTNIPVCRTFIKDGAPQHDAVYDNEDGSLVHSSDYGTDMENVENPLEDRHYFSASSPMGALMLKMNGRTYF